MLYYPYPRNILATRAFERGLSPCSRVRGPACRVDAGSREMESAKCGSD